jgi:hypothetical protein
MPEGAFPIFESFCSDLFYYLSQNRLLAGFFVFCRDSGSPKVKRDTGGAVIAGERPGEFCGKAGWEICGNADGSCGNARDELQRCRAPKTTKGDCGKAGWELREAGRVNCGNYYNVV